MKHFLTSIGTPIVESKSGKTLTKVSDLVFDTEKGLLQAVITDSNTILFFSDVYKWGTKIHIKSDIFLHSFANAPSIQKILEQETSIVGNKAMDENDIFLGYCEDFSFHEKNRCAYFDCDEKKFFRIFLCKALCYLIQ